MDWKIRSKWNKFEVYMQEQVFTFRNNSEVVNLLNVFQYKVFPVSFVINEKKTTAMKSFSIYFGHYSLTFLNSFLNILNKYNILVLNKYNLEYVICLFVDLFLQYFGGRESSNTNTHFYFQTLTQIRKMDLYLQNLNGLIFLNQSCQRKALFQSLPKTASNYLLVSKMFPNLIVRYFYLK